MDRAPYPSHKTVLQMRLLQHVLYTSDSGLRRYGVIWKARNENNWRNNVAATQSIYKIDTVYVRHFIVDDKTVSPVYSDRIEECGSVPERLHAKTVRLEQKSQRTQDALVIIDYINDGL